MPCNRYSQVPWQNVSDWFLAHAPDLKFELDRVLDKDAPLAMIRYPYGAPVVEHGYLSEPCSRANCQNCNSLKGFLGTTDDGKIPLTLSVVKEKSLEVSYSLDSITQVPLNIIRPGEIFGLFETLDRQRFKRPPASPWIVTAGSRTAKLVSNVISNSFYRKEIAKALECSDCGPKGQPDWEYIRNVTASKQADPWSTTIYVVPSAIFDKGNADRLLTFSAFRAWDQSRLIRHRGSSDFFSGRFVDTVYGGMDGYFVRETLSAIIAIAEGVEPAFVPFHLDTNELGPFGAFRDLIASVIGTDKQAYIRPNNPLYHPLIMQPKFLTTPGEFGYASFSQPHYGISPLKEKPMGKTHWGFVDFIRRTLRGNRYVRDTDHVALNELRFTPHQPGLSVQPWSLTEEIISEDCLPPSAVLEQGPGGSWSLLQRDSKFFKAAIRIVRT